MSFDKKILTEKAKIKRTVSGLKTIGRKALLVIDMRSAPAIDFEDLQKGFKEIDLAVVAVEKNTPKAEQDRLFMAADIALVFSDAAVEQARRASCVPVAPQLNASMVNYTPVEENGNGFFYKAAGKWAVFGAVVRALETYQFPYDWENVMRESTI